MVTFGTKIMVLGVLLIASMEVIDSDIKAKDYANLGIDAAICISCLFSSTYYLFWCD